MSLLAVAEAQERLLAQAAALPVEIVPLIDAVGRWAAEEIVARRTQPAADLSMMDGYAIRFADLPGPWRVVGESRAGAGMEGAVQRGEAVRIFTGAPVPVGADTILVQDLFVHDPVSGGPVRTGLRPGFATMLEQKGIEFPSAPVDPAATGVRRPGRLGVVT